ncbi:hypothetical protein EG327_009135 [Venturia inaequalis]|uniref:Ankyrin repeat protein n=2 Tax=Venturia inaequalis TaxID=5025 RepID=A0A8H3YY80_VENIN|nr:hypothetical protein EG327_009135 [Venturia inaequalis]
MEESIEDVSRIVSGERQNRVGSDSDNHTHDLYHDPTEEDGQEVTELDEIFQSLADSISSLFKISLLIRSATPRDRYAKAATSVMQPFDESFDISHCGHKYPKLEKKEYQWLRNRLGKAITQRRQYLKYCRDHHDKLGARSFERPPPIQREENAPEQAPRIFLPMPHEGSAATIMYKDRPASTLAFTTASTLMPGKLDSAEQDMEDNRSEFSDATSMADDIGSNQLHVIDIEKASQGMHPFECPYCFTLVRIRRQRSWKKHVFHDLKPYVCTIEDCDIKMFSDRHAWFTHELETHRNEYHCLFCPSLSFSTVSSFKAHLLERHADQVTDAQSPAIVDVSKRSVTRILAKDCPCCDEWAESLRAANPQIAGENLTVSTTQFRHHLANHLEQLALFSLPRNVNAEDIADIESKGTNAARAEPAGSTGISSYSIVSEAQQFGSDAEIHRAAHEGHFEEVARLLSEGADVNSVGPSWGTALHAASNAGRPPVVELLIRHGADIELCVKPFGTALQAACRGHAANVVSLLLTNNADPNANSGKVTGNISETTALHVASSLGHESIVETLLEAGADVNGQSGDFNSIRPLHLAASKGYAHIAQILLDYGAEVDAPVGTESPETPLSIAAAEGWEEVVVVLINAGASFAQSGAGTKALHRAAYAGHLKVMRILIDSGADVNLRSLDEGSTPLHTATAAQRIGVVNFLLKEGAEVHKNRDGNTALHVAAANGFLPITKILRAAKADIFSRNLHGETPLDVAARCGHVDMVRYLLDESLASNLNPLFSSSLLETAIKHEHREIVKLALNTLARSSIEISAWRKSQAIFAAASAGQKDIMYLLTSNGFNVDEENELSETPLQTAASMGNVYAVRLLLEAGANIDLATARGTALCYAASVGDAEIVSYLLTKGASVDLNTMRAASDKPTILSLLQWRDPARSEDAEKAQPPPSIPPFSTTGDERPSDQSTRFGSGPTVILSSPDRPGQPSTDLRIVVPTETADWQSETVEKQLQIVINRATQNDLDLENMERAFAVADIITNNNETLAAPLATQIICRRLKHSASHVQLQTLSLASVLMGNCGLPMRRELVSERFCYTLTRLTNGENSFEEVKRVVVGMISDWLDRPDLFVDLEGPVAKELDLTHLQNALDIILTNDGRDFLGSQKSIETAQAAGPIDLPEDTELFSIDTNSDGQPEAVSRESGRRIFLYPPRIHEKGPKPANYCEICMRSYTAGEAAVELNECGHLFHKNCFLHSLRSQHGRCLLCALISNTEHKAVEIQEHPLSTAQSLTQSGTGTGSDVEDPFSNWSGAGRHPVVVDHLTNLPTRESTIYHGGRFRFHSVRWKSYILTRKTAILDDDWTRKDAFREVESLDLLIHSHIVQVVGSYSLGNRFSILCYPGTEWTLHQFLTQTATSSEEDNVTKRVVARFFTCLVSALGYIHGARLRHQNLRPRTILVARSTSHQERYKVYLTGFEFVHTQRRPPSVSSDIDEAENETEDNSQGTRSPSEKGKYAPVEQFTSRSADIFSLGCIYLEMMAVISNAPKARDRLQSILNSKARDLGKASFAYREHVEALRKWIKSFSTDVWAGNGYATGLEANSRMETNLTRLTRSMIDDDPAARPTASIILDIFGGEHDCCRRGRDPFGPDWFGANRALRDRVLQEADGSLEKFKETS